MPEAVIWAGTGYAIVDRHGDIKTVRYQNRDAALMALESHVRAAKRKRRPCMTCRKPFDSEGAHNRMCDRCRQTALPGDWMGMGA